MGRRRSPFTDRVEIAGQIAIPHYSRHLYELGRDHQGGEAKMDVTQKVAAE
jgi:hypothetical protein